MKKHKIFLATIFLVFSNCCFSQEILRPDPSFHTKVENGKKSFFKHILQGNAFDKFWGNDTLLNKTTVLSSTTNSAAGSIYTDLYVDNLADWKLSVASALVSTNNDTIRQTQSFLAGGGNLIVKGTLPIILWASNKFVYTRNLGMYLSPRVAANVPALGNTSNQFSGNIDAGTELHFFLAGNENKIAFIGRFRAAVVYGTKDFTKKFVDGRQYFGYGQGTVGVVVANAIVISGSFPLSFFGVVDPVDKLPSSISVGFQF